MNDIELQKTPLTDALDIDLQHDVDSMISQGAKFSDIFAHVLGIIINTLYLWRDRLIY